MTSAVVGWAAAHALEFAPERGLPVLEEIAQADLKMDSLDAEMTIKMSARGQVGVPVAPARHGSLGSADGPASLVQGENPWSHLGVTAEYSAVQRGDVVLPEVDGVLVWNDGRVRFETYGGDGTLTSAYDVDDLRCTQAEAERMGLRASQVGYVVGGGQRESTPYVSKRTLRRSRPSASTRQHNVASLHGAV